MLMKRITIKKKILILFIIIMNFLMKDIILMEKHLNIVGKYKYCREKVMIIFYIKNPQKILIHLLMIIMKRMIFLILLKKGLILMILFKWNTLSSILYFL